MRTFCTTQGHCVNQLIHAQPGNVCEAGASLCICVYVCMGECVFTLPQVGVRSIAMCVSLSVCPLACLKPRLHDATCCQTG